MASPETNMGPVAVLLDAVNQTTVAVFVVLTGLLGGLRALWNMRAGDMVRMTRNENEVALARRDIATLQAAQNEVKEHLREYQEALANKPDREEIFRRLDALPNQVAMLLSRGRD